MTRCPGAETGQFAQIMQARKPRSRAPAGTARVRPAWICPLMRSPHGANISVARGGQLSNIRDTREMELQLARAAPLHPQAYHRGATLIERRFDTAVNDIMARPQGFGTALAEISSAQAALERTKQPMQVGRG